MLTCCLCYLCVCELAIISVRRFVFFSHKYSYALFLCKNRRVKIIVKKKKIFACLATFRFRSYVSPIIASPSSRAFFSLLNLDSLRNVACNINRVADLAAFIEKYIVRESKRNLVNDFFFFSLIKKSSQTSLHRRVLVRQ